MSQQSESLNRPKRISVRFLAELFAYARNDGAKGFACVDSFGVPKTYGRDRNIFAEMCYTESLGKDFLTIIF